MPATRTPVPGETSRPLSSEILAAEQRDERRLALQRLAPALFAVDQAQHHADLEAEVAPARNRLQRRAAGRHHVLEDGDRHPGAQRLRALEPLTGAVALRLLAHVERR